MRKILKELGSHSLTYFAGSVAISASSIFLLPVYTRYLSKTDYGILEILDSMNSMLLILFMSGLGSAYAKFHNETTTDTGRKEVFGTSFWFILVSTSVWVLILHQYAANISHILLDSRDHTGLITLSLATMWVNTLYILFTYYLNVHKMPGLFLGFSLAKLGVNIILNLIFIVHLSYGPKGMLLGDLMSSAITGAVLFAFIVRRNGLPFRLPLLRRALYFGLPFVPSLLCAALMHRVDRYMLEKFTSLAAVGIYSIGYKLPFMLGSLIMQSFGRVFGTSAQFEIAQQENAGRMFSRIATYFFIVVAIAEFSLGILSTTVLRILTVPAYYPAAPVIQILAAGVCVYSIHSFFLVPALVRNKTWYLPVCYFLAALTAVVLNYLLLPRFGYLAAAVVMTVSYLVFGGALFLSLNRFFPIPFEFLRMGALLGTGIATMLLGNALVFPHFGAEVAKQLLLVCVLPVFVLFTPFLRQEEAAEVAGAARRFLPGLADWYIRVRKLPALMVRKQEAAALQGAVAIQGNGRRPLGFFESIAQSGTASGRIVAGSVFRVLYGADLSSTRERAGRYWIPAPISCKAERARLDALLGTLRGVRAEGYLEGLEKAESIPFVFENPDAPHLKRLRETFGLERIVMGAAAGNAPVDEYAAILRLGEWLGSRWDHGTDEVPGGPGAGMDAVAVIEEGMRGKKFWCEIAAKVAVQAYTAMGWPARLSTGSRDGFTWDHGLVEVWSGQHSKWIALDTDFNVVFEAEGVPQSCFELCHDGREHQARGRLSVRKLGPAKPSLPLIELLPYFAYVHIDMRSDWASRPLRSGSPAGGDYSTWWTARRDFGRLISPRRRVDDRGRFDWPVNRAWIRMDSLRPEAGGYAVGASLCAYAPFPVKTQMALNGGAWKDAEGSFELQLPPGEHAIAARVVSSRGWAGAERSLRLTLPPLA